MVRVPLELDRRIFTPIARTTAKWKRTYDRRTAAVERVNARLDRVFGFELRYLRFVSVYGIGFRYQPTRLADYVPRMTNEMPVIGLAAAWRANLAKSRSRAIRAKAPNRIGTP